MPPTTFGNLGNLPKFLLRQPDPLRDVVGPLLNGQFGTVKVFRDLPKPSVCLVEIDENTFNICQSKRSNSLKAMQSGHQKGGR